jgi:hypothetical protein
LVFWGRSANTSGDASVVAMVNNGSVVALIMINIYNKEKNIRLLVNDPYKQSAKDDG